MVSAFIKVRNTDFRWINMTVFQCLETNFYIQITLESVNRLELIISRRKSWGNSGQFRMILFSDEKRAGMINVSVKPMSGSYTNNRVDEHALEAWETVAETLRFSLAGKQANQKCWNCFEEIDFRDNFCKHCGKS